MSTAQGGAAAAAEVDDGFTPEERELFAQMESETPAPEPGAGDPGPADAEAQVNAQNAAEAGADDDDDADGQADQPGGDKPAAGEQQRQPRRVNFAKFARMEERAKKAEGEVATMKETMTRFDERMKLLNEALSSGQKAEQAENEKEDPEPDVEQDVFGYIRWQTRQMARMSQMLEQGSQREQSRSADSEIATTYIEDARAFATKNAAFIPAYDFLMRGRIAELAQFHYGKDVLDGDELTPVEMRRIKADIAAEEKELVSTAIANKKSPAEAIFKMAKARGFRPPAAAGAAAGAAGAGNGKQPGKGAGTAAAARVPGSLAAGADDDDDDGAAPSVAAEIERVRQGKAAARSLSQGGGAPPSQLTPEAIANMPQDEFNRLMEGLTESQQHAIFGG